MEQAPSNPAHKVDYNDPGLVRAEVGAWNTDIALGWTAGLKGKTRVFGRLVNRQPPEHFLEPHNRSRWLDWLRGYTAALQYRKHYLGKEVHWVAEGPTGSITGHRKGWGISRGAIVTMLIDKHQCFGDVYFFYYLGNDIVRRVKCGI